ncbi:MAG: DNA translocase FtsK 4TM domain-containing protein [Patescibacteria group bacterium]|nr:DNA translocase FtsK 4TM domain-containing protein [Patescibacteria group bacterium]
MGRRRKKSYGFRLNLDAQTQKGIVTVILFAVAIFLLLSLFDLAGAVGTGLDSAMAHVFGWDKIVLPFFIFTVGIFLYSPSRLPLKLSNGIGFLLFFIGFNPLIHLLTFKDSKATATAIDAAAGKLGMILAEPFIPLFGVAGAIIFFAAIFGASLVLIFNTSLSTIGDWLMSVVNFVLRIFSIIFKPLVAIATSLKNRKFKKSSNNNEIDDTETEEDEEEDEEEEEADEEEIEEEENETGIPKPKKVKEPKPRRRRPKIDIPFELLTTHDQKPTSGDIESRQLLIQRTLETFGIPVEMGEVAVGPTVTQFTFKPAEGIKLNKITALHNDLAMALAAHPIRIEAPIPGKSMVGVEVPNQSVAIVGLRELFETKEWRDRKSQLTFSLGRDVTGKPWHADVCRMPHLLVAGATGSGKSVCLNSIIMSLLYSNGPDDLKLILVDPKRVEFPIYNGIPHLITPVITDVDKTINSMKWAVREMNKRFDMLSKMQCRDIATYNARCKEKLPYIVMIVDELADLMVNSKQEVESQIVRLAQMSRAVGIHLILATQRPSVDVITGLIKANIPARIAFSVASLMDSRTIIDQSGAEKLIGRGDMLYSTAELSSPRRIQGVYLADDEINRVVEYLKSKYEPADYDPEVVEHDRSKSIFSSGGGGGEGGDALLHEAKEEIIRAGKASASLLQRRLKVGYARAARILDLLEEEGFIGPADGAKPREILKADFTNANDPADEYEAEEVEEDEIEEEEEEEDNNNNPDNDYEDTDEEEEEESDEDDEVDEETERRY